jgi:cell division initiation protein
MEKFNRTLRGYDPDEVNHFLDQVIQQVEQIVKENKEKDARIKELEHFEQENRRLVQKLEQYEKVEGTLNRAIVMAQKTSDQMRASAHQEAEVILSDAKKNANRIVNEALLKAEKAEDEAARLNRNMKIFKRRVKEIIEAQLEVVEEIDQVNI